MAPAVPGLPGKPRGPAGPWEREQKNKFIRATFYSSLKSLFLQKHLNLFNKNKEAYSFSILSWITLKDNEQPLSDVNLKKYQTCVKVRPLYSQALRRLLQVLWPHLNPVAPAVRGVQTPAALQSRPQVEPPRLRVREGQGARGAPEPHVLLYCRGIRSRNYPGEEDVKSQIHLNYVG